MRGSACNFWAAAIANWIRTRYSVIAISLRDKKGRRENPRPELLRAGIASLACLPAYLCVCFLDLLVDWREYLLIHL